MARQEPRYANPKPHLPPAASTSRCTSLLTARGRPLVVSVSEQAHAVPPAVEAIAPGGGPLCACSRSWPSAHPVWGWSSPFSQSAVNSELKCAIERAEAPGRRCRAEIRACVAGRTDRGSWISRATSSLPAAASGWSRTWNRSAAAGASLRCGSANVAGLAEPHAVHAACLSHTRTNIMPAGRRMHPRWRRLSAAPAARPRLPTAAPRRWPP
jgi:hypothetical protein